MDHHGFGNFSSLLLTWFLMSSSLCFSLGHGVDNVDVFVRMWLTLVENQIHLIGKFEKYTNQKKKKNIQKSHSFLLPLIFIHI